MGSAATERNRPGPPPVPFGAGFAPPPPRSARLAVAYAVGPIALYVLLSLVLAGPHVWPLTRLTTFSYDSSDSAVFAWNFAWMRQALEQGRNPYWTDRLLHPWGASLSFHTFPLAENLASLPFQALVPGASGLIVAFNILVFASFVLSAVGAYFLALHVCRHRGAALVAGILFAYMPFRFLNTARLQLVATYWLAFYVLAWLRFRERPCRGRAFAVAVLLAGAYYTSIECALHLVLFTGLSLACDLVARRLGGRMLRGTLLAAAAFTLLAGPLLALQARDLARGEVRPERSLRELESYTPALLSLVVPSRVHPVYGRALASLGDYGTRRGIRGMRSETSIALTAWGLALLAAFRSRKDRTSFWVLAAGTFLILTLGPRLRLTGTWFTSVPLPYRALYELLPPARGSRDSTRFLPLAMLMISVLAACGANALLRKVRPALACLLVVVLAALAVFEDLTMRPHPMEKGWIMSGVYRRIAAAGGDDAVLDLGANDRLAFLAQTIHGHPTTAGALSIPRAAAAGRVLDVQRDFQEAGTILSLAPAVREERLRSVWEGLFRHRIGFVVLRDGSTAPIELARLVGCRLYAERGLVVAEVPRRYQPLSARARMPREARDSG